MTQSRGVHLLTLPVPSLRHPVLLLVALKVPVRIGAANRLGAARGHVCQETAWCVYLYDWHHQRDQRISVLLQPTSCARSSLALSPLHRPGLSGPGLPVLDPPAKPWLRPGTATGAEPFGAGCADGPDGALTSRINVACDEMACGQHGPESPSGSQRTALRAADGHDSACSVRACIHRQLSRSPLSLACWSCCSVSSTAASSGSIISPGGEKGPPNRNSSTSSLPSPHSQALKAASSGAYLLAMLG